MGRFAAVSLVTLGALTLAASPASAAGGSHLMVRAWLLPDVDLPPGAVVPVVAPPAVDDEHAPNPGPLLGRYGREDRRGDLLSFLELRPGEWSSQVFSNVENEVHLLQEASPEGLVTLRVVLDGQPLPEIRLSTPEPEGRAFLLVGDEAGRTTLVGLTRFEGMGP